MRSIPIDIFNTDKPKTVDERFNEGASLEDGLSGKMQVSHGYNPYVSRNKRGEDNTGNENRAGAKIYD